MKRKLTSLIYQLTPPIIYRAARQIRNGLFPEKANKVFEGPIATWEKANERSQGWDAKAIAKKTLAMAMLVRDGVIEFEQDTIQLEKIRYSPTILAFIAIALSRQKGYLRVVDFGGSLATN